MLMAFVAFTVISCEQAHERKEIKKETIEKKPNSTTTETEIEDSE